MKDSLAKFLIRERFFSSVINSGMAVLAQEGEELYKYCETGKVPEEVKEDLATVLADMTLNCNLAVSIGGIVFREDATILLGARAHKDKGG